jgi:hypothetical protein
MHLPIRSRRPLRRCSPRSGSRTAPVRVTEIMVGRGFRNANPRLTVVGSSISLGEPDDRCQPAVDGDDLNESLAFINAVDHPVGTPSRTPKALQLETWRLAQGGTISLARWVGSLQAGFHLRSRRCILPTWTHMNRLVFPQLEIQQHSGDSERPWNWRPQVPCSAARPRPGCTASRLNPAIRSK